jgi:soluble lytic murein transglycosylase-like protein
MPMAMRQGHRAARRRNAAFGVVLALVLLLPKLASAEMLPAPTSFVARFAAVESPEQTKGAPANAGSEVNKESRDGAATSAPPPAPGLDAHPSYRALVEKEAGREGLPPEIAEAVMAVESGYNAGAIGGAGEIGLMQILPSTARMLGFAGTNADLAVPDTNIHYGVTYLARAWRLAGGDLCTAVMKYRAGHGESRFSILSVNYCMAVRAKLAARGYHVTGVVPIATFGERGGGGGGGGCGRKCLGGARIGRVDLAALNTRLSTLVLQARGGR